MQIILDPTLKKIEPPRRTTDREALAKVIHRRLGENHKFIGSYLRVDTDKQLGFVGMLSSAYSLHEKVEIAPHDIWYLVLSEIATIIKSQEQACRPLFTRAETGKIDIKIPVSDITEINLHAVVVALKELVPVDVNVFVPRLSNITPEAQVALYAALADGVQGYYSYSTFMCGIPEIRLTGTPEDWNTLYESARQISSMFASVNFKSAVSYMDEVSKIIESITETIAIDNRDFWKDIFHQKNIGSGGELEINGWITKLYYKVKQPRKLENFTVNNTIVPYKNLSTGRNFKGVYGAFERIRTEDDFLRTIYSHFIFEVME